jgi:hypothetical protein
MCSTLLSYCCKSVPKDDIIYDEIIHGISEIVGTCLECDEGAKFEIINKKEGSNKDDYTR